MTTEVREIEDSVGAVLARYQRDEGFLVSILQDVQTKLNYLPREALLKVSQGLDVPLSRVYSVATFFKPSA